MDQTALLTGASSGIGLELAKLLAGDGIHLVLVDIREDALLDFQRQLQAQHPSLRVVTLVEDLAQPDAADRVFQAVRERGLEVDLLINNAGFGALGPFVQNDWEKEGRMLQLHVHTLTHFCKLFIPGMVARGRGRVMNVASVAGFQPSPLMAVYNASKAYVLSFSEAIANELEGTGVTVTVLCPGLTRTGFQAGVGVGEARFTKRSWLSASAGEVAEFGYRAMFGGKTVAIPGVLNVALATAHRFLPRKTMVRMVRKVQERNRKGERL
jgi:short-subunit dehydrogenase